MGNFITKCHSGPQCYLLHSAQCPFAVCVWPRLVDLHAGNVIKAGVFLSDRAHAHVMCDVEQTGSTSRRFFR